MAFVFKTSLWTPPEKNEEFSEPAVETTSVTTDNTPPSVSEQNINTKVNPNFVSNIPIRTFGEFKLSLWTPPEETEPKQKPEENIPEDFNDDGYECFDDEYEDEDESDDEGYTMEELLALGAQEMYGDDYENERLNAILDEEEYEEEQRRAQEEQDLLDDMIYQQMLDEEWALQQEEEERINQEFFEAMCGDDYY